MKRKRKRRRQWLRFIISTFAGLACAALIPWNIVAGVFGPWYERQVEEAAYSSEFGMVDLLCLLPAGLAAFALAWFLLGAAFNRRRAGQCPYCDYDLTGNVSGTCPECGTPVP